MTSPNRVRIAFIGAGGMGQCAHLRSYSTLSDCEIVALAEPREKTARCVAQRYGIPSIYSDHQALLENEQFDALVASQPFDRHGILVPDLLRAGKPLFIEKPLANSVQTAERINDTCEKHRTWIMPGYHKRSDPASMYAKAELDRLRASGELGTLRYIRILMPAGDWTANGFSDLIDEPDRLQNLQTDPPPPDMNAETFSLYTEFVNYYIHQVNLLRYFLGESYRIRYADPSGVLLAAESDSGIPCAIEMSPYYTTVDWQESVLIAFTHGYIKLTLPAPLAINRSGEVEILHDPGNGRQPMTTSPQLPWIHAMRQQAINFLAAVRSERKPMCDAHEALEDLRTAREYLQLWKGC